VCRTPPSAPRRFDAELTEPAPGVAVVAHEDVAGHDRYAYALGHGIRDRGREPGRDGHVEARSGDPVPVREAEAHVGGTAGRIDLHLIAQAFQDVEGLAAGAGEG